MITSKNTSVNTSKVPAVYKKINYEAFHIWGEHYRHLNGKEDKIPTILDWGCGRKTDHIRAFLANKGIDYVGYDPHWGPYTEFYPSIMYKRNVMCIVCSNVLNVIQDDDTMNNIHRVIKTMCSARNIPYFITVYEGDKSGTGRETKPDCWQRNKPARYYVMPNEILKYGVIYPREFRFMI